MASFHSVSQPARSVSKQAQYQSSAASSPKLKQPSLMSPVLFLLWQLKMSIMKFIRFIRWACSRALLLCILTHWPGSLWHWMEWSLFRWSHLCWSSRCLLWNLEKWFWQCFPLMLLDFKCCKKNRIIMIIIIIIIIIMKGDKQLVSTTKAAYLWQHNVTHITEHFCYCLFIFYLLQNYLNVISET